MEKDKAKVGAWRALLASFEELSVDVAGVDVRELGLEVASGWRRRTSVVGLRGPDGAVGEGEDVTYAGADHDGLQGGAVELGALRGPWRLGALWDEIAAHTWFERRPAEDKAVKYRRCALETAALELALGQAGTTLEEAAARQGLGVPEGLAFCVSLSLDGSDFSRIDAVLARDPGARFKIDFAEGWDARTLERLVAYEEQLGQDAAAGARVRPRFGVVDFKGFYRGEFSGPRPDAGMYGAVAAALPHAWLEDPWLGGEDWEGADALDVHGGGACARALEAHAGRVTFDAPFASAAWLDALPWTPRCLNVKPSRLGGVRETLEVLARAAELGIELYVGGQFELGPGRTWLQRLARLACAEGPNDCAPTVFNERELPKAVPTSPLRPA